MIVTREYDFTQRTENQVTYVEKYKGQVLETWTESVSIMSDVYGTGLKARVWDDAKAQPVEIIVMVYESSAEIDKKCIAEVDATEETWGKYFNWQYNRKLAEITDDLTKQSKKIVKGCSVRVISGRMHKGAAGTAQIFIDSNYNLGWKSVPEQKVGVATSDKTVPVEKYGKTYQNYVDIIWVWMRNLERTDNVPLDMEIIKEMAWEWTVNWYNSERLRLSKNVLASASKA